MQRIALLILLLLPVLATGAGKEPDKRFRAEGDDIVTSKTLPTKLYMGEYNMALLNLALSKTESIYGPYTLTLFKTLISNVRFIDELGKPREKQRINAHVAITSIDREAKTIPVRIPARMGLLNYRLIVVRKEDLHKFINVRSIDHLRPFKGGSAKNWITTDILRSHRMPVVEGHDGESAIKMLEKGRFDYFFRGVNEVFVEQEQFPEVFSKLTIVPGVVIYMPLPYYIFVAKTEPRIADRLRLGLEMAVADGSLRELFLKYYGEMINLAEIEQRDTIYIRNYFLSDLTPRERTEYWYFANKEFEAQFKQLNVRKTSEEDY